MLAVRVRISQPRGCLNFCSVRLVVLVSPCRLEQLRKCQSLGNEPKQRAKQRSHLYQHGPGGVHLDSLNSLNLVQNEEVWTASVNGK